MPAGELSLSHLSRLRPVSLLPQTTPEVSYHKAKISEKQRPLRKKTTDVQTLSGPAETALSEHIRVLFGFRGKKIPRAVVGPPGGRRTGASSCGCPGRRCARYVA